MEPGDISGSVTNANEKGCSGDMYRKSARGWEKHLDFMIWDQLSLQIAFLLAYML